MFNIFYSPHNTCTVKKKKTKYTSMSNQTDHKIAKWNRMQIERVHDFYCYISKVASHEYSSDIRA